MNARPVSLDRADRDVESRSDLRRRQVLPVRQVRDRALARTHRKERVGDRRIGVVIFGEDGRSDLVLSAQPASVRTPMLQCCTMNASVQVQPQVVDGRRGLQHVQNRNTQNVGCV